MASHKGVLTLAVPVVLLALASLTHGETFHIIMRPTSTNTSCPTDPCLTLSEYAQSLGQYFNGSNLTLEFLPGNHTFNVNVTIKSINRLEILGNSSEVVPTRIVCSSHVCFAFSNIFKVRIDGLAFCFVCGNGCGFKSSYNLPWIASSVSSDSWDHWLHLPG